MGTALIANPVVAQTQGGAANRAVAAWAAGDHTTAIGIWMDMPTDADALYNLGQAYRTGRGVPVMADRAEGYYQRALNAGHVRAGEQLGLMFLARPGTRQQGLALLSDAANRGSARASFAVGLMLAEPGPTQDVVRARSLIQTAANANVPGASDALSKLSGGNARPAVQIAAVAPVSGSPVRVAPVSTAPVRIAAPSAVTVVRPAPAAMVATSAVTVVRPGPAPIAATRAPAPKPAVVAAPTYPERPVTASERRAARAVAAAAREAAPVPGIATDKPAAPVVAWWQ